VFLAVGIAVVFVDVALSVLVYSFVKSRRK